MMCGGCVSAVRKTLEKSPGVTSAAVNLATRTAAVRVGPGPEGSEAVRAAMEASEAKARLGAQGPIPTPHWDQDGWF